MQYMGRERLLSCLKEYICRNECFGDLLFVVRQSSESLLNRRINRDGVKPCVCLQVYYPEALL